MRANGFVAGRAFFGLAMVATLVGGGLLTPSGSAEALARRHLTLDHALPGPDSVMSGEIQEVRLFFSEAPQMRGTSIRVIDPSRSLITSTPPSAYEGDQRQVFVKLQTALPAGVYTVQWRVMALDGHVQRDEFTFRVTAE